VLWLAVGLCVFPCGTERGGERWRVGEIDSALTEHWSATGLAPWEGKSKHVKDRVLKQLVASLELNGRALVDPLCTSGPGHIRATLLDEAGVLAFVEGLSAKAKAPPPPARIRPLNKILEEDGEVFWVGGGGGGGEGVGGDPGTS
jgi:hypothetical protein